MKVAETWACGNKLELVRLNSASVRKDAHEFYRSIGYGSEKEQIRFMKKL